MKATRQFKGWTLALSSIFLYSFAPIATKIGISEGLSPTNLLMLRLWLSALLLLSYWQVIQRRKLSIDRRGLLFSILAGIFQAISMGAFIWSLAHIDVSVVTMSFSVYPVLVVIGISLISRSFSFLGLAQLSIGLSGIYLLVGPSGAVDASGLLLVVLGVFCFSTYMLIAHYFLSTYKPREVTILLIPTMAASIFLFWLLSGGEWQTPNLISLGAILFLAVIVSFLAQAILLTAVQRIGGEEVALLAPTEMLLTVVWAMLFLGERLRGVQWVGGLLILISVGFSAKRLQVINRDINREVGLPGPS